MKRLFFAFLFAISTPVLATASPDNTSKQTGDQTRALVPAADTGQLSEEQERDQCLLRAARNANKNVTLKELRDWCTRGQQPPRYSPHEDALRTRLALERNTQDNPFVITPHHRNYLLPVSYWSNPRWNDPGRKGQGLASTEVKFQLSLKAPLYDNFWNGSTLYMAFTGVFYWQAYNESQSRPFREINYTPEIFVAKPVDWHWGPIHSELLEFGLRHDSNGRNVPASRSWNRLYINHISQIGSYYVSVMPWYRIPEQKKNKPSDTQGDDNPDIQKYMGHFQVEVARAFGNHVIELMLRNNLSAHNKGAERINYSFPINKRFKGLVQIFSGYGDSLINYNNYETRVSIGILLTDTL